MSGKSPPCSCSSGTSWRTRRHSRGRWSTPAGRADVRRLVDPVRAVDGTDAVVTFDAVRAAVERRAQGARPAGGRGRHAARPRACRARRRQLRPAGAPRRLRRPRPGRPPAGAARARRDAARGRRAIDARKQPRRSPGLAEAEASPAPDRRDARGRRLGGAASSLRDCSFIDSLRRGEPCPRSRLGPRDALNRAEEGASMTQAAEARRHADPRRRKRSPRSATAPAPLTVIGGGTIVCRRSPTAAAAQRRACAAPRRAGLSAVTRGRHDGDDRRGDAGPGAGRALPEPLGPCAANVADSRSARRRPSAATSAPARGHDAPRGDLQGPLLALGAQGALGRRRRRARRAARGLPRRRDGRLVLDVAFEEPAAAPSRRSTARTRTSTRCSRSRGAARRRHGPARRDGRRRRRSGSLGRGPPPTPTAAARSGRQLGDDALASGLVPASGRCPVLVRRVLTQLEEAA